MDLSKQLDGFELKLRQLASQIDRQRAEKESVEAENKRLKSELDRQRGAVNSLKEKLEKASTSVTVAAPSETATATAVAEPANPQKIRAELDHCLREIDACIDWLQQQ